MLHSHPTTVATSIVIQYQTTNMQQIIACC
jgi:hypothetical protein